jgi:hypothetical protein
MRVLSGFSLLSVLLSSCFLGDCGDAYAGDTLSSREQLKGRVEFSLRPGSKRNITLGEF